VGKKFGKTGRRKALAFLIFTITASVLAERPRFNHQEGLKRIATLALRARVTAMTPEVPVYIRWGFGEGTEVNAGSLCHVKPEQPELKETKIDLKTDEDDLLGAEDLDEAEVLGKKKPQDRVIVDDGTFQIHYLKLGAWTPAVPMTTFLPGERYRHKMTGLYTFGLIPLEGSVQSIKNAVMEFEILHKGKPIKRIVQDGKHGPTIAISLRGLIYLFYGREVTAPEFADNCLSLVNYVKKQRRWVEELPWGRRPLPKRFPFTTICAGHQEGYGYGIKHTSPKVTEAEYEIIRVLGINGLRGGAHMAEWMKVFGAPPLTIMGKSAGYPLPQRDLFTADPLKRYPPGSGCPFYPANVARAKANAKAAVARMSSYDGVKEFWGITEDEIGSAFTGPAKTAHVFSCDYCIEGYRNWIKGMGLKPADFGRKTWQEIDPWDPRKGPRPKPWRERTSLAIEEKAKEQEEQQKKLFESVNTLKDEPEDGADDKEVETVLATDRPGPDDAAADPDAMADKLQKEALDGKGPTAGGPQEQDTTDFGRHMMNYYLSRFYYGASAMLFDPLRRACDAANEAKRRALGEGRLDSPEAKRPFVHSYALRQQHVYGGAVYNFYRYADNGFMYETSSHDVRYHIFDSLYCDVGRVISRKLNKRFGILIKPVRGSTLQRGMTFIGREGRMIYWYNYGPKYGGKITSVFSHKGFLKERVSRFSRIVARAEDVVYNAEWAYPAEVAIVWPLTTAVHDRRGPALSDSMSIWLALTHAHIPVDPLDEGFLLTEDLSRYKVIFVSGAGLRRDVSERLAEWARDGGTLYSGGRSLVYDEGKRPLEHLLPVMGLKQRQELREATGDQKVVGQGMFRATFTLTAGHEPLASAASAEVLVKFADGAPAVVRNGYGKGQAYTVAFVPGKEYRVPLNKPDGNGALNMEACVSPERGSYITAPVLERTKPVVDTGKAYVEGILLQHPKTKKLAVTLVNWAYEREDARSRLQETEWRDLEISIRVPGQVSRVVSAWLDKEIPMTAQNGAVTVTLPELKDADILLLE